MTNELNIAANLTRTAERQPDDLATTETARVQQHDRQQHGGGQQQAQHAAQQGQQQGFDQKLPGQRARRGPKRLAHPDFGGPLTQAAHVHRHQVQVR